MFWQCAFQVSHHSFFCFHGVMYCKIGYGVHTYLNELPKEGPSIDIECRLLCTEYSNGRASYFKWLQ